MCDRDFYMLVLGMKDALESFAVAVSRFVLNVLYAVCCLLPRKDEAMFVSRQANEPSYDFLAIGGAFEDRGYSAIFLTLKLRKRILLNMRFMPCARYTTLRGEDLFCRSVRSGNQLA